MAVFPFKILQEHAPKAKFHEPCNGCGLCCRVEACEVSKTLLGSHQAPCIALEFRDGKYVCGMVTRPEHYCQGIDIPLEQVKKYVDYWIAPGQGCDMPDTIVAIKL